MAAFEYRQAEELREALARRGVRYLFLGKSGAILLGFPDTTQDVDLFPERSADNGRALADALGDLGFTFSELQADQIVRGKDFVQLKSGPFDVDLVFAPDGIASFSEAKARSVTVQEFRIANLRDVIASKRASGCEKDLLDLHLLERFREEYERL